LRVLPCCLVPDSADASVQVVRLAMERALTDRADKAFDRGVVDLVRFDALPAGVARQPRQSDAMARFRKLRQQLGPTRAQRSFAGRVRWLKPADVNGRQQGGMCIDEVL